MSLGVFEIDFPRMTSPAANLADGLSASAPSRSFLSGEENRLAAVVLASLAGHAETPFNPLTLHGPSGCGKSHLALTLACEYQQLHPSARVLHTCGSDFAHEFAAAVERRAMDRFRNGYRTAAMLVLDGLDQLAEKPAAQQELLWTIDALLQAGGRAIVIGLVPPQELPGLLPTLRDRLLGGLCAPVVVPGPEARLALLQRSAANRGIALSSAAAAALAAGLPVAAPVLCGALIRLAAEQEELGEPLDMAAVRKYLAQQCATRKVTLREIAQRTARQFKLTLADLKGPARQRKVSVARSLAIYLARQSTDESLESIGRYFGGRDHTTALHSVRRTAELIESDPAVRTAAEVLRKKLNVDVGSDQRQSAHQPHVDGPRRPTRRESAS